MSARSVLAPLALPLIPLALFALANDTVVDRLEGRRLCLDQQLAVRSAEHAELLCVTPGVDGPPLPATDLGGLLGW